MVGLLQPLEKYTHSPVLTVSITYFAVLLSPILEVSFIHFERFPVQISAHTPAKQLRVHKSPSQSFQANDRAVPQIWPWPLTSIPSPIQHSLITYHLMPYNMSY